MEPEQPNVNSVPSQAVPPMGFVSPQPIIPTQTVPPQKSSKRLVVFSIVLVVVLCIVGAFAYAYVQKIGPFSVRSYSEETFFSSVLASISQMNSASYSVSGSLDVVPRDTNATPFTVEISNADEIRQAYYYDTERMRDVSSIMSALNTLTNYRSPYYGGGTTPKLYPSSVNAVLSINKNGYGASSSITDPSTDREYEYRTTDGGKNFLLTVNFQTGYAINAIKRYNYTATTTIISGRKVSFTKDSYPYLYMSSEPPKPFLVQMSESMRSLPADIGVKISFGASSELKSARTAGWVFHFDAEGDFGDLTYKVNAEALKKDSDYYFRINNIPSLFLFGDLGTIKGKWVKITPQVASTTDDTSYSALSYLKTSIPDAEEKYKKNRENLVTFIKKVVAIADEEKLIYFKTAPRAETIDGRRLVRYELSLRKDAMVPFYTKLQKEIDTNADFSRYRDVIDQGLIEYLQSKEFEDVFDYVDKNNTLVFWTDTSGFPAGVQNTMRVIPPDTATQLENKQISIVFKLLISDINKPINIQAPAESISIEKVISDFDKNLEPARLKGKSAALKAHLSTIRAQAEITHDSNAASYGKNPFNLGPCKQTSGTLFADKDITKYLEDATEKNISRATCISKGTIGHVTSYAISIPLPDAEGYSWCIDSVGASKQIMGKIKSDVCR